MKKLLLPLICLLVSTLTISSCSKDDDVKNSSTIIGTWELVEIEGETTATQTATFNDDSTFTLLVSIVVNEETPDNELVTGTYETLNDLVILTKGIGEDQEIWSYKFLIDDNELSLTSILDASDTSVFTKKD